ncbi:MAG: LPS translocon maturation chaperone LptM [Burkholderiaceae bacterium]
MHHLNTHLPRPQPEQSVASRPYGVATVLLLSISLCLILGGCGQKGPLVLPKPQFPAPPAETPRP